MAPGWPPACSGPTITPHRGRRSPGAHRRLRYGAGLRLVWAKSMALETDLARRAVCAIETTGRRSGLPRLIEIQFAADPERDRIYLLSGGRDRAHWVRNLCRNPAVRVRIDGRWYAGVATEIEGDQDDGLARRLLAARYQGWAEGGALSDWARTSLPLAIDLRADAAMTSPLHDRGAVSQ